MPVTVFAALGPNPAPLAELIWGLQRQRAMVATDLFVVVDQRGHDYLQLELLGPGKVLSMLAAILPLPLGDPQLHLHVVPTTAADDDPAFADAYNAVIWQAARDATVHAGDGRVVFGLTAGRRRTMTAMSTMAFQLLARAQDLCLDVRVRDKRAEGGAGFYFPEQPDQIVVSRDGDRFAASDVGVLLIDVQLPRLRGLLTDAALASYASALAAGQVAVDAVAIPRLRIDLRVGTAHVDGALVPLSSSELVWYAALALARTNGEGWIASSDLTHIKAVLAASGAWIDAGKSNPIRWLAGDISAYKSGDVAADELLGDLKKLRTDTRQRLTTWCTSHRPSALELLRPVMKAWQVDGGRTGHQRIALDSTHIELMR